MYMYSLILQQVINERYIPFFSCRLLYVCTADMYIVDSIDFGLCIIHINNPVI